MEIYFTETINLLKKISEILLEKSQIKFHQKSMGKKEELTTFIILKI